MAKILNYVIGLSKNLKILILVLTVEVISKIFRS